MQPLVELCLSLGELDGNAQLVLLGLDDRVRSLLLGARHVLAQLRDVVIVLRSFCEQPAVDRDHRGEAESQHEHKSGVSTTKVFPAATPAIAFAGPLRPASRLGTGFLFGSEESHFGSGAL